MVVNENASPYVMLSLSYIITAMKTCQAGFEYYYQTLCYQSCPVGTYSLGNDDKECVKCNELCVSCKSSTVCT